MAGVAVDPCSFSGGAAPPSSSMRSSSSASALAYVSAGGSGRRARYVGARYSSEEFVYVAVFARWHRQVHLKVWVHTIRE